MLHLLGKSHLFDCNSLALVGFCVAIDAEPGRDACCWSPGENRLRGNMLPKPRQDLVPNTAEFERLPFVKATGFREYDARWRYPEEINLLGLQAVGLGLATLMRARGVPLRIVTGHDYRSYSAAVKAALDRKSTRLNSSHLGI